MHPCGRARERCLNIRKEFFLEALRLSYGGYHGGITK